MQPERRDNTGARMGPLQEYILADHKARIMAHGQFVVIILADYSEAELCRLDAIAAGY